MFKIIVKFVKRLIMAVLFIYGYNKLSISINAVLPINIITVLLVSIFGVPSIIMLFIFSNFLI